MSEAPLYVSEHMCASLMSRMSGEPLYDANACRTPTERLDLLNRNLVDCTLEPQPYQQTPDPAPTLRPSALRNRQRETQTINE